MNLTDKERSRIREVSKHLTPQDIECLIISISTYTCTPGAKTKGICTNHCAECWIEFLENLAIRRTRNF